MILQAFEHQKIKIGKNLSREQWQALVAFAQLNRERYFKILHDGIQLSRYVGVLQVGTLTIEILPKIAESTKTELSSVLPDLLRECRLLRTEQLNLAALRERRGTLLEIYIEHFLQEMEQILHNCLIRNYASKLHNRSVFKGKLAVQQQIQHNFAHPERFFTTTLEYSYDHPFNQWLYAALLLLEKIELRTYLKNRVEQMIQQFPSLSIKLTALPDPSSLRFNRQTLRYKNALTTALLLLRQSRPDLRAGQLPVLALVFDMNLLFEEFIFRQLQSIENINIIVKRQVPQRFWNRRPIQPDILLIIDNQNIVIDTKWKKLQKVSPAMEDLRQMFVYNQYFQARHSVLVYPWVQGLEDLAPVPFQPTPTQTDTYFCQVRMVELSRDGQLNRELGTELLRSILQTL